jgi:hypothetical protein
MITKKIGMMITLVSYLLIILPEEKWDVVMIQAFILGLFGIYDLPTFLYVFCGYAGVILWLIILMRNASISPKQAGISKVSLILLPVPLLRHHIQSYEYLTGYDHWYYVIPELIFIVCAIMTFSYRTANRTVKSGL